MFILACLCRIFLLLQLYSLGLINMVDMTYLGKLQMILIKFVRKDVKMCQTVLSLRELQTPVCNTWRKKISADLVQDQMRFGVVVFPRQVLR